MDEDDGFSSEKDDSYSLDLVDEWKNWRADDTEFESDDSAEEGVENPEKEALVTRWEGEGGVCGTC